MLRLSYTKMKEHAEALALRINSEFQADCKVIKVNDAVGGGSYPEIPLEGWGVSIKSSLESWEIQKLLRESNPPILSVLHDDEIIIHVRTLQAGEDDLIIKSLRGILENA